MVTASGCRPPMRRGLRKFHLPWVVVEVPTPMFGEGLILPAHALAADYYPEPGGHLAYSGEYLCDRSSVNAPGPPSAHQIRSGYQPPRASACSEHAHRLAGLPPHGSSSVRFSFIVSTMRSETSNRGGAPDGRRTLTSSARIFGYFGVQSGSSACAAAFGQPIDARSILRARRGY